MIKGLNTRWQRAHRGAWGRGLVIAVAATTFSTSAWAQDAAFQEESVSRLADLKLRRLDRVQQAAHESDVPHQHQTISAPLRPQEIVLPGEATPLSPLEMPSLGVPPQAPPVMHDPLWSGYNGATGCGCSACGSSGGAAPNSCSGCSSCVKKQSPVRKALGKLSAGFDLIMFGRTASSMNASADCGCDSCDNACDAMGAQHSGDPWFGYQHSPAEQPHTHVVQPQMVHDHHEHRVPQPRVHSVPPSLPVVPSEPSHQVPASKQQTLPDHKVDPFADDPVTVSRRPAPKPSLRRR